MRAIIIEEERFAEILEILKKQCVTDNPFLMVELQKLGIPADRMEIVMQGMFRTFNLHFVRWAQSHGASCVHN
jgi:hypothetical protein